MKSGVTTFSHKLVTRALALAVLAALFCGSPVLASAQENHDHSHASPAKLVQIVRDATQQFIDVNAAGPAGYGPAFGCVSGPDHGAMGVHFVNGTLVGDGLVDANHPEALIYEPVGDKFRLVGVEYIVFADGWNASHNAPPMLEGQAFQFVASTIDSGSQHSTNCTCGRGATIRKVRSLIGITR